METKEIYERVNRIVPTNTVTFLSHLNATIDELLATYDEKYVLIPETIAAHVEGINDGINIYGEYITAIVDNILFFASGAENRKTDYIAHAEYAYRKVWRRLIPAKPSTKEQW